MPLTAQQAAEAVGITKHGIIKSIRNGRISASKNTSGAWEIEPSELFRVYKAISTVNGEQVNGSTTQNTPSPSLEISLLQQGNAFLEEKITDLQTQLKKAEEITESDRAHIQELTATMKNQTLLLKEQYEKTPYKPTEGQNKQQATNPKQKPLNALLGGLTLVLAVCLTALLTYLFSRG